MHLLETTVHNNKLKITWITYRSVLLLLLYVVHVEGMGLVDLADEELVIGQKLLLVDDGLIQEHTCNDTSGLISIDGLDGGIDTVSYEVLFLFSVNLIEA